MSKKKTTNRTKTLDRLHGSKIKHWNFNINPLSCLRDGDTLEFVIRLKLHFDMKGENNETVQDNE